MKTYILLLIWVKVTNNSIRCIYYTAKVDTRFPIQLNDIVKCEIIEK